MNPPDATSEDVRHAYRLLLGRDPEPAGLAHFGRIIGGSPHTSLDVAGYFLGSPEFLSAHGRNKAAVEVDLGEYSVYVSPEDRDIGKSVSRGVYEPHVAAVVRETLRRGDTFVDVGANIGYFVAMAANLVGPSGHVIAIEPMDKNVQLISAAIWRNKFHHVEVHPVAAGKNSQVVAMMTSPGTSNGEIIARQVSDRQPALFAQARPLDDLLAKVDRIDLIKFDIEGHEMPAWQGFAQGMSRHQPLVLTEFHPHCMRENAGIEPEDYLRLLFGYADCLEVLLSPTERIECTNPADVMEQWNAADRRHGCSGTTHLDIFVRPRSWKRRPT